MLLNTNRRRLFAPITIKTVERMFLSFSRSVAWVASLVGITLVVFSFVANRDFQSQIRIQHLVVENEAAEQSNTPEQATEQFRKNKPALSNSDLKLGKIWIETSTVHCKLGCQIEIPNIRSSKTEFWYHSENAFKKLAHSQTADGISVTVPPSNDKNVIVGQLHRETLHRISVIEKKPTQSTHLSEKSERDKFGGMLFGSLLSLSIFCLVVSILNRDSSFLILSGWLVATCRTAAFNGPWDFYWLGLEVSSELQIVFQKVALSFYAVLSVALFLELLDELLSKSQKQALVITSILVTMTIPLAFVLPTRVFFPTFWGITAISLVFGQVLALKIAVTTKQHHIVFFNVAWFLTLAGIVFDILFATGHFDVKPKILNTQTGAVGAALIMSIVIADKMRRERIARIASQSSLLSIFKKFKNLYGNVPVGLATLNENLIVLEHNVVFATLLGLPSTSLLKGKSVPDLMGKGVLDVFSTNQSIATGSNEFCITVYGKLAWLRINIKKVKGFYDCSFEDITVSKLAQEKLEFLARHDALTGFKNRYEFDKILHDTLQDKAKLSHTSVAHIDIKGFKLFNELFGHALGDEILQQFAGRIESANKRGHQIFRLDGDDFYVIFSNMDGPTVEFECAILQDALSRRHYVVNQRAMALEVGIGIVHLNDGISANDVHASASEASDRAKRSSETKVIAVSRDSEDLKEQIQQRHLMASMKQRFPEERLFLHAQPIISLADPNGSLAYEVLVRLKGENGGVISPGQFIPAAEKNGLMSMVDRWVLNETLVWLELNKEHAKRVDFITVNLSGASLNDLRFAEDALAIIKEHRQLASKICFEVTESVALFDLKATLRFVEQTKSFGCKLALDDFGAGYTSFKYLKDIPSDILKIDGSYVRGINKSVANHAIVKAITDLTHEMGMKCVAEWIEDIPTIRTLQRLGMDYGQGFGMSRPMPMDDITAATSGFDAMTEPAAIDFYSKLLHLPHRRMNQSSVQSTDNTVKTSGEILLPTA
jgi:diguanylate cyclase (GGDEF)-like protein